MNSYFGSRLFLLPNYFKKIGLGIIIIWAVCFFSLIAFKINLSEENKLFLKQFILSPFLLGFSLIGLSKDKVEDELTMFIRLKSILWAFFYVVFFIMIIPIINLFGGHDTNYDVNSMAIMMLFGYLSMYYYQKIKR